jgi:hypothetical protein
MSLDDWVDGPALEAKVDASGWVGSVTVALASDAVHDELDVAGGAAGHDTYRLVDGQPHG